MNLEELTKKFPYLSIGKCGNTEIIGVVQNASKTIVAIYDYGEIHDKKEREEFLHLASEYWWHSNRKISIDIFFKGEFDKFKKYMKSFNTKEYEHIHGPLPSLGELANKRPKRKKISLIKKL